MLAACTHASLVPSVSVGYTTILAVLWPFVNFTYFVNFIWFVNFPCFAVYVCFITFFLLIKAFGLGRPVERYNHDLSPILQRYGPSRHPSLASINSIAIGKAMLLRTLLLALLNCARHSDDYRTSMAAQVEILALINQLNASFLADIQRVWEASLILLRARESVVPANWLRQADLTDEATDDADVDWYQEYKQSAIMDKLPSLPRTDPYRLLQPKAFVSLFRLGRLAPRDAYWALPETLIGHDVPPMARLFQTATPLYSRAFDLVATWPSLVGH
ncbi:hypothetical protein CNMCM5878_009902 [Aspergillus fumigatiaffinis]|nr:hypothetical protein CNMCM5878_009902 [Aspergillus fumigatiaffinis]KAF4239189.1 hypothetical protein CNMCM6457_009233 [Aspergillus fumigatiaffinis]